MDASEPKWVNSDGILYEANSLKLGKKYLIPNDRNEVMLVSN